jgi:hypothetical protein
MNSGTYTLGVIFSAPTVIFKVPVYEALWVRRCFLCCRSAVTSQAWSRHACDCMIKRSEGVPGQQVSAGIEMGWHLYVLLIRDVMSYSSACLHCELAVQPRGRCQSNTATRSGLNLIVYVHLGLHESGLPLCVAQRP